MKIEEINHKFSKEIEFSTKDKEGIVLGLKQELQEKQTERQKLIDQNTKLKTLNILYIYVYIYILNI